MRCPRVDSGIGKQTSFGISARDGAAMSQCRSIHGLARSLARSLVRPAHLNGGGEAAAVQHRPKLGLEVPAALPRDHSRQIQFSLLYGRESEFSCKLYIFLKSGDSAPNQRRHLRPAENLASSCPSTHVGGCGSTRKKGEQAKIDPQPQKRR